MERLTLKALWTFPRAIGEAVTINSTVFLALYFLGFLFFGGIGIVLLYFVFKIAVKNGVKEATEKSEQHLQGIKDLLLALTKAEYTKSKE